MRGLLRANELYVKAAPTTPVEALTGEAATVVPPKVAPTVREARSSAWGTVAVVIPVCRVTMHCVPAGRRLCAAVSVRAASEAPESLPAALKVVAMHDDSDGVARVPKLNVGSTNTSVSPMSKGALMANVKATSEGAPVTGMSISSLLYVTAKVGTATAIESGIAISMSLDNASVAETLRVPRFADCVVELLDTPDGTMIVQGVSAVKVAPLAVRVKFESPGTTAKLVEPHPAVVTPLMVPTEKVGRVNTISSETARGALSLKE